MRAVTGEYAIAQSATSRRFARRVVEVVALGLLFVGAAIAGAGILHLHRFHGGHLESVNSAAYPNRPGAGRAPACAP